MSTTQKESKTVNVTDSLHDQAERIRQNIKAMKDNSTKSKSKDQSLPKSKDELIDDVLNLHSDLKIKGIKPNVFPSRIKQSSMDHLRFLKKKFEKMLGDETLVDKEETKLKRKKASEALKSGQDKDQVVKSLSDKEPSKGSDPHQAPSSLDDKELQINILKKASLMTYLTSEVSRDLEILSRLPAKFVDEEIAERMPDLDGWHEKIKNRKDELTVIWADILKDEEAMNQISEYLNPWVFLGLILSNTAFETIEENYSKKTLKKLE